MIWAESWCDVGNFVVAVVGFLAVCAGGAFAFHRWRHERQLERAGTLKNMLAEFDASKLCELVNRLDSEGGSLEWFAQLDEEGEKEVMKSFRFLSYICYLHEKKLLSKDEFVLFESQIKAVLRDEDAKEYLNNTSIEGDGDVAKGQFAYLIRYARSVGEGWLCESRIDLDENAVPRQMQNVEISDFTEPTAIIKINQKYQEGMNSQDVYDATRGWWRVRKDTVEQIKLVLSVEGGIVRAAYRVSNWHYQPDMDSGRMAFDGDVDNEASKKFVGRSVKNLFTKGAANPIRYFALDNGHHS